MAGLTGQPPPAQATTTSAAATISTSQPTQRRPQIEEVFDED